MMRSLFPNQFVNIHLEMEHRPNAMVVPSAAIQNGLQGTFVWAVDTDAKGDATAKIDPVKVALAQGQVTIVDSGVSPGDKVVVDGADRLRPGSQCGEPGAQRTARAPGRVLDRAKVGAAQRAREAGAATRFRAGRRAAVAVAIQPGTNIRSSSEP